MLENANDKKILVILNYQREIPPFMISQISIAKKHFEEVIYITPKLRNDNSHLCDYDNVKVVQIDVNHKKLSSIVSMFGIFSNGGFNQIARSFSEKRASFGLVKFLIVQELCSNVLYKKAEEIILSYGIENVSVIAVWFSVEAFAVAKLGYRHKMLSTYSFAHSFEVDPLKNPYVDLNYNLFKHQNIGELYFISEKILETYKTIAMDKLNIVDDNISVKYLGSIKTNHNCSKQSSDGTFRIVSCSGVTEVKRVHLILESLKNWDMCSVEWTHIGGGPLFSNLELQVSSFVNEKVKIHLLGNMPNKQVQDFYSSNCIDLFVNVSAAEGLPVSIMECMAYGIPAIATEVGGNSEIVIEMKTGMLINCNFKTSELTNRLMEFYSLPSEIKREMRINSYDEWETYFNAERNFDLLFGDISQRNKIN